jgi:hypothetical protein
VARLRALRLLLPAVALAVVGAAGAAPPRPTGGLAFGAGTLVDPQRLVASPVLAVDPGGGLWVTGRALGAAMAVARSTDGGDSFRLTPTPPPVGGGDAAIAAAGGTVYVATAAAGGVSVAATDDGGATWRTGTVPAAGSAGAPSLAVDGSSVFLAFDTSAGTTVLSADVHDLRFGPAAGALGVQCGRIAFDPLRRVLYLPCLQAGAVGVASAQVPAGRRSGLALSYVDVADTGAGDPMPSLAVDSAGAAYVVWADRVDRALHAAVSQDGGLSFVPRAGVVNGEGADTAEHPVAVAGAPGTLAVAWLGTAGVHDPATVAAGTPWYVYAALVTPASIVQQRVSDHPAALGPIGTDTLDAAPEPSTGALDVVYADASDPGRTPQALVVRQLAGPTAFNQSIVKQPPANGVVDGTGDAPAPELDLTKLELSQPSPETLRVTITLAAAPSGAGTWETSFRVLTTDGAYTRIVVGAESGGGAPTFFAGTSSCPAECPGGARALRPAAGRVEGTAIVVDVPLATGLGVRPAGDQLYDVTGLTLAGGAEVDSLAPFDYRLQERIGPTTRRGKHVVALGTIRSTDAARAAFHVDVFQNKSGKVTYLDPRGGIRFRSTKIASVRMPGRAATISGTGLNGSRRASFTATITDRGAGRLDSFGIRIGSYRRSGRLLSGNASIRSASS